jgi:hypothetical protein
MARVEQGRVMKFVVVFKANAYETQSTSASAHGADTGSLLTVYEGTSASRCGEAFLDDIP